MGYGDRVVLWTDALRTGLDAWRSLWVSCGRSGLPLRPPRGVVDRARMRADGTGRAAGRPRRGRALGLWLVLFLVAVPATYAAVRAGSRTAAPVAPVPATPTPAMVEGARGSQPLLPSFVRDDPPDIEERVGAHHAAARAAYASKEWSAARDHLRATLAIDPEHAPSWTLLGSAQLALGAPEEAVAAYTEAVELGARDSGAWNNLGIAQIRAGRSEDAIRSLRTGSGLAPEDELVRRNLAIAIGLRGDTLAAANRYADAADAYREAWSLRPSDPNLKFKLGCMHSKLGAWQPALRCFRSLHAKNPRDADTLTNLVLCHAQLEQWRRADEMNGRLEKLDPPQAARFQRVIDPQLARTP